ncbi:MULTISPECIES: type 1 glutamine amidotransferase [Furfurilactobacillus]|uniref:Lipid II isoglutaminyl synthase (glutamine-hydrolyzing) subunit GatD n=2 Tax=Furfurilactobacillus TaxID=2767882 RepID=A0A0R1R6S8_9LACO|nr:MULTISPECIES: DJ-1/PfpI family protein [Furfurilactobacillus]KRL53037.1 glutamine amidotransferase [Furfurilactobacillus rossiae DSM 15814]MCF6166417.1 DJ-1/PfpI family protein [Furfurilactobacillus rossiae]MYV17924.1 glutamine amidotransferase [Furfurilactobacillus milii]QFR66386.1 glutamine amidotransferase [Furfurilactobacillus rossiae]QLE61840.1 amidotransferase similar to cobyric acid synthase [Furfurilactobacillus rossiae]
MANYHLTIAHLYGDLMNTYGDVGNILAMQYYAKKMDADVTTKLVSLGDPFDPNDFDIVFFGGGQDFEQTIVAKDLPTKAAAITDFIEDGGPTLAICGGFQLLGQYYIGADGERITGTKSMSHYTKNQHDHRFIGDTIIKDEQTGEVYHGFENHQGMTFLGKDEAPLGVVSEGAGNNGADGTEGVHYKNVYGTYFHGPILTRNGDIAKHLLVAALKRKYPDQDFSEQENMVIPATF